MSLESPLKISCDLHSRTIRGHTHVRENHLGYKMILPYFEFRTLSYIPTFDSWAHIAWCTCSKRFTMSTTSASKQGSEHSPFARHVVNANQARTRTNLRPFLPGTEPWVLRPPPGERSLACLTAQRPKARARHLVSTLAATIRALAVPEPGTGAHRHPRCRRAPVKAFNRATCRGWSSLWDVEAVDAAVTVRNIHAACFQDLPDKKEDAQRLQTFLLLILHLLPFSCPRSSSC